MNKCKPDLKLLPFFCFFIFQILFLSLPANPIDSLKQVLSNEGLDRKKKLELYTALSQEYVLTSMDSAQVYSQKALQLAGQLPPSKAVVQAYLTQASLFNGKYMAAEAQAVAQQALALAKEIEAPNSEASALKELGLALKNATRYDTARKVIYQAISLARQEEDLAIESVSENVLAQIFGREQAYDSSIHHYEAAVRLGMEAGKVKESLAPMYNMAIAYYNIGQYDSTKSILYRAVSIGKKTEARRIQGAAHSVLANLYNAEGQLDSSMVHIEAGIAIADSLSVERMYGYYNLADLYLQEGEYEQSLAFWRLALGQAGGINSIAQGDIQRGLGQLYLKWGKLDSALYWLDLAEATGKKFGSAETLSQLRLYRAQALGQQGKYREAVKTIEPALEAKEAEIALLGHLYKAIYHKNLGEYQEAKPLFQKSLSMAQAADKQENISSAYYYLSKCDSALGNTSSALRYMSLYANKEVDRLRKRYKESVAEFETKFATAQKESQIKTLEQDNRIQQLEISRTAAQRNALLAIVLVLVIAGSVIFALFVRIRQQREELAQANATKDRLFSIISHDLRGPVTGLQSVGRIFDYHLKKGNTEVLKAISQQVDQQAAQVKELLDNLLTWSLQQLGVYESKQENIALKAFGEEIMRIYQQPAKAKEIQLKVAIEEDAQLFADRRGLNIVLTNLINNAVKYTEKGEIVLAAYSEKNHTQLRIEDTGMGMSPRRVEQLMKKEVVSSQKGSKGEQGTGLGWQIIHELVERWGAGIQINSEEGKGSQVEIIIPRQH